MKTAEIFRLIRKPMPRPVQVLGERKRKNAYNRKEKHKKNFED
jgi:hypothetical protein